MPLFYQQFPVTGREGAFTVHLKSIPSGVPCAFVIMLDITLVPFLCSLFRILNNEHKACDDFLHPKKEGGASLWLSIM